MGMRGCIISAMLAESEEQLQKSFSSAGASHTEFELLSLRCWKVHLISGIKKTQENDPLAVFLAIYL